MNDISPDFKHSKLDAGIIGKILPHAQTGKAIRVFNNHHRQLSDYAYWFTLGTLWVNYSGWSELALWRRLLSSDRPNRDTSLMKPSELAVWRTLPPVLTLYRAHRPDETDWIAYTLDAQKAAGFASRRGVDRVGIYTLPRPAALCLFLRRGEAEILALDRDAATFQNWAQIVYARETCPT